LNCKKNTELLTISATEPIPIYRAPPLFVEKELLIKLSNKVRFENSSRKIVPPIKSDEDDENREFDINTFDREPIYKQPPFETTAEV
jgi:hypothetical protein